MFLNAPFKKKTKVVRANHAPYMNRTLRKAIIIRSELERKCLKNRTNENRIRHNKQKNFCSKLHKKEWKKYYSNNELKIFRQ